MEITADMSEKLCSTLELEGYPVAVKIVDETAQGFQCWQRRSTLCIMIQSARRGFSFYCSGENVICSGGSHVGISNPPIWDIENFLIRCEKVVGSRVAARKMLDLARDPAPESRKYLLFYPLGKTNLQPDVVVFVGVPLQISRILFLDGFETGEINALHREPLCSGVIATPITTGQIGISFMDMACRSFGQYRPEEMAVGVPYHRVHRILDKVECSSAGNARSSLVVKLLTRTLNHGNRGTSSKRAHTCPVSMKTI